MLKMDNYYEQNRIIFTPISPSQQYSHSHNHLHQLYDEQSTYFPQSKTQRNYHFYEYDSNFGEVPSCQKYGIDQGISALESTQMCSSKHDEDKSSNSIQENNQVALVENPHTLGKQSKFAAILIQSRTSNAFQLLQKRTHDQSIKMSIPANICPYRSVYIFLDQVLDLDYIKSISQNNELTYLEDNKLQQTFSGIQMVQKIHHRLDNRFIEAFLENTGSYCSDLSPIIAYIRSLGNKQLYEYAQSLESFWMKVVQASKQNIRRDREHEFYNQHSQARRIAAEEQFIKITKSLPSEELSCYFRLEINYKKEQFDVIQVGYSPMLYSLIGGSAYEFIDFVMRNGYFDPLGKPFRLKSNMKIMEDFTSNRPKEIINKEKENRLDINTIDNFVFPSTFSGQRYDLNRDYDQEHGITFLTTDILTVAIFQMEDLANVIDNLTKIRENKDNSASDENSVNRNSVFDFKQTEFFEKYYSDQVKTLVRKGDKWFKRCGYVDIPQKKKKTEKEQ